MIPGRFETFGLKATLEGIFPFQGVGSHMAQDCEVFRRVGVELGTGIDILIYRIGLFGYLDCHAKKSQN